jgi:hypothetical protein
MNNQRRKAMKHLLNADDWAREIDDAPAYLDEAINS